ncbi:MAG: FprA family A-type flavoprotein [Bacilli bacterium]|nr:FprA family A-type flavoprotein [Bacilli bacterium]
MNKITENIINIGANDYDLDLFEGQYEVPSGMAYNSYLILDDKIAILETIDKRKTDEWFDNLKQALNGLEPYYLVISHLEPDHAFNIQRVIEEYPNIKLVGNKKTFEILTQFFQIDDLEERKVVVGEGATLCLGHHTLRFIMAPMVHWPEVMMEYEETEHIFFSADAFGKFGTTDAQEEWDDEARRYYFNIVGKYGMQVQALFKKIGGLDIKTICPLHGPILNQNLEHYLSMYNTWSKYESENKGVLIACASIHGNTYNTCLKVKELLVEHGIQDVKMIDLTRLSHSEALSQCFKYQNIILAASTYNLNIFTPMRDLLLNLQEKGFQNKNVAIIENGSWSPMAATKMVEILASMKNVAIHEPIVTIKSTMHDNDLEIINNLIKNLMKGGE